MDTVYLRSVLALFLTLFYAAISCANPTVQLPSPPVIESPTQSAADISINPTLEIGPLQLQDKTGSMIGQGVLKEVQWLISKENQVALVGGNTLGNNQRAQVRGKSFDISGLSLSLSGQRATSVYIDAKRLEVTASGSLLGYIELPEFIYQAEIKDEFDAARVRFFNDGIVVQWHYGDANAVQPWELIIQAVFSNDQIAVRFDQVKFDSAFINTYGTEEVRFSDESTWHGHQLINIFNSGNMAYCSLMDFMSNCSNLFLAIAELSSMVFVNEIDSTTTSSQFAISQSLAYETQYYWRTRQAIDDGAGGTLYGNWTSYNGFSTEVAPVVPVVSDIQVAIGAAGDYVGQVAGSSFHVSNMKGQPLQDVSIIIEKPMDREVLSLPEECSIEGETINCLINSNASHTTLHIQYKFLYLYSEKSYLYKVCIAENCSSNQYENFGGVEDLNELTNYSAQLSSSYDLSRLTPGLAIQVNATIQNISSNTGLNTQVAVYTSGDILSVPNGCSIESLAEGEREVLTCVFQSVLPNEERSLQFEVSFSDHDGEAVQHILEILEPCELEVCPDGNQVLVSELVRTEQANTEGGDSSGGGAMLFIPLLACFYRRRKF